jgi:hypothetical protein
MVTEIVGKCHRQGISKTSGKPYDFSEVHYLGRKKGVEGLAAVAKTVGADIIAYDDIAIGEMYDIERDDDGNIIGMAKAKMPAASSQQTKT